MVCPINYTSGLRLHVATSLPSSSQSVFNRGETNLDLSDADHEPSERLNIPTLLCASVVVVSSLMLVNNII
jgi:hypothetical protein